MYYTNLKKKDTNFTSTNVSNCHYYSDDNEENEVTSSKSKLIVAVNNLLQNEQAFDDNDSDIVGATKSIKSIDDIENYVNGKKIDLN